MVVKNYLKQIRHEMQIDHQEEMASLLGVAQGQYSRFENQKAQPTLETALRISEKLKRSVNEIFWIDETPGD
jgi:putative transcriptional regulator